MPSTVMLSSAIFRNDLDKYIKMDGSWSFLTWQSGKIQFSLFHDFIMNVLFSRLFTGCWSPVNFVQHGCHLSSYIRQVWIVDNKLTLPYSDSAPLTQNSKQFSQNKMDHTYTRHKFHDFTFNNWSQNANLFAPIN